MERDAVDEAVDAHRSNAQAVELAQRASRLSGTRDSVVLDTLAVVYAEEDRLPEAVPTAQRACLSSKPDERRSLT